MNPEPGTENRTAAPRQTQSYLRNLLQERGLSPKSKLGQNFLIDLNLLDLLVRTSEVSRQDLALEIGTGTGSLTTRLAELAGAVLSVEIDRDFHSLARDVIPEQEHVVLLHSDILENKNRLSPRVLSVLTELREKYPGLTLKIIANLPYVVATPVIANFLTSTVPVERFVVTVQWEIAARLAAHPGTSDYGALSVLVQSLADVEIVRRLAPGVFWPRPKVDSAIVCIRPDAAKREVVGEVGRFRDFVRDLYTHRRKNLRGSLVGLPHHKLSKEEVDRKLAELGLDGKGRAEDLDLVQHRRLCEAFAQSGEGDSRG